MTFLADHSAPGATSFTWTVVGEPGCLPASVPHRLFASPNECREREGNRIPQGVVLDLGLPERWVQAWLIQFSHWPWILLAPLEKTT